MKPLITRRRIGSTSNNGKTLEVEFDDGREGAITADGLYEAIFGEKPPQEPWYAPVYIGGTLKPPREGGPTFVNLTSRPIGGGEKMLVGEAYGGWSTVYFIVEREEGLVCVTGASHMTDAEKARYAEWLGSSNPNKYEVK